MQQQFVGYEKDNKDYYFDSYSHFSIHEEMLKDNIRTKIYMNAILNNPQIFLDKIVLDIGSGTGVLSIFAAKAGAKHVYAIENANIYRHSKLIIQQNGFTDRITVIKGKVEQIQLPVKSVDIIISQWMGYFLLYQSMLDTVIFARDKWLNPDGLLFPDRAVLYLSVIQDQQFFNKKMGFWDNVHGITMKCMKKWVISQPMIDAIKKTRIISSYQKILELDLYSVKVKDLDFNTKFSLQVDRNGPMNAFLAWFNVEFNHGTHKYMISTSPFKQQTHWKQTIFYIDPAVLVKYDDVIRGQIKVKKNNQNFRQLDINITFGKNKQDPVKQFYRIT